jgi:hypothetical protein
MRWERCCAMVGGLGWSVVSVFLHTSEEATRPCELRAKASARTVARTEGGTNPKHEHSPARYRQMNRGGEGICTCVLRLERIHSLCM